MNQLGFVNKFRVQFLKYFNTAQRQNIDDWHTHSIAYFLGFTMAY